MLSKFRSLLGLVSLSSLRNSIATTSNTSTFAAALVSSSATIAIMPDVQYPGTAVERMNNARNRVREIADELKQGGDWEVIRRRILWAGGLRDLPNAKPGMGYTGHSFNDFNHVDLTCMLDSVSGNENEGQVDGIAYGNQLGPGIRLASLPELGPGGSWSTCMMGCKYDPPRDVAHLQFRSRIAFKLVWVPTTAFDRFVLVDDDGNLLAEGRPQGRLPPLRERQQNYQMVAGSKYAAAAVALAANISGSSAWE